LINIPGLEISEKTNFVYEGLELEMEVRAAPKPKSAYVLNFPLIDLKFKNLKNLNLYF
jgi:hypothetical protein